MTTKNDDILCNTSVVKYNFKDPDEKIKLCLGTSANHIVAHIELTDKATEDLIDKLRTALRRGVPVQPKSKAEKWRRV